MQDLEFGLSRDIFAKEDVVAVQGKKAKVEKGGKATAGAEEIQFSLLDDKKNAAYDSQKGQLLMEEN